MINVINGFFAAISLYSVLPVKTVDWKDDTIKYAMVFFPFIGIVISLAILAWYEFCVYFGISSILFASFAVVIPIIISGGIHVDGFMDTIDAISSHKDIDGKLLILKDPHVGAMSVIYYSVYIILSLGLWSELYRHSYFILIVLYSFVLSRIMSGASVLIVYPAKKSGIAYLFNSKSHKKFVLSIMSIYFIIVSILILINFRFIGLLYILLVICFYLKFIRFCKRSFNGINGDLAGFFMQYVELFALLFSTLSALVVKIWFF